MVTGGGSGIGRAVVHALVESGAKVVVVADISEEGGAETVELVGGSSAARFVATDVSDESSVNGLVEETLRAYGRLDIAHNNAGMGRGKMVGPLLHEIAVDDFQRLLAVYVMGCSWE